VMMTGVVVGQVRTLIVMMIMLKLRSDFLFVSVFILQCILFLFIFSISNNLIISELNVKCFTESQQHPH
jgi:uncharacterized membrane protein